MHTKFARSVGADFFFVDPFLRWHDRPGWRLRRYLSWIVCALKFPQKEAYDVFLVEGPHFSPVFMRWFRTLSTSQKIVCLLANETLYFLKAKRYPPMTRWFLRRILRGYDGLICIGAMEAELAQEIVGNRGTRIYVAFNGVPSERIEPLRGVQPALESLRIVFIGSGGPVYWRAWYKGLDIMLRAFKLARERIPELHFTIVGEWSQQVIQKVLEESGLACADSVTFIGRRDDIEGVLQGSSLYLHCARGDAYGISVLEAMCAGVVPIVSEWTGTKEVVAQVDKRLVVPLQAEEIAKRILWYFEIGAEDRKALSERCRDVVANYTEERAVQSFQEAFRKMVSELYG